MQGNLPTWRSNSLKKDNQWRSMEKRSSSLSPAHKRLEINQVKGNQVMYNQRDLRAKRKMLKSAHPSMNLQNYQYL